MTHPRRLIGGLFVSISALVLLAAPAFAAGDPPPSAASSTSIAQPSTPAPPDFLIGRPKGSLGIQGSWFMVNTGSDFYETVIKQLTLDKSSFRTTTVSIEAGYSVSPQLDVRVGLDLNRLSRGSEDRHNEELLPNGTRVPIKQVTELSGANITASAKFSLVPRGRSVSRLAWIPTTFVPYVGAGLGMGRFSLHQNGDFVDFVDNHIFSDTFESSGWAPVYHAFGGVDLQVLRHMALSAEARYTWEKGDLGADFLNFQPITLGGLRVGAGIHLAF